MITKLGFGMNGYGVDPDSLVSTGEQLVEIADEAREAKARFIGAIAVPEGANSGFTTASKAASLAELWEYYVDVLCKRTAVAGGLLEDSSDGYREMEQAVLETLPPLSSGERSPRVHFRELREGAPG